MNRGYKQSVISGLSDAYATVFRTSVGKQKIMAKTTDLSISLVKLVKKCFDLFIYLFGLVMENIVTAIKLHN